jgi:hypothetical protein
MHHRLELAVAALSPLLRYASLIRHPVKRSVKQAVARQVRRCPFRSLIEPCHGRYGRRRRHRCRGVLSQLSPVGAVKCRRTAVTPEYQYYQQLHPL